MINQETDAHILSHIGKLVDEEHRLQAHAKPTNADRERLKHIGEQLDQSWDLLRQRRARHEFGQDPRDATLRPAEVVEKFQP